MPVAMRPGDVLAGRYRLVDLLSEARGGRFWCARDEVLARPVALHVIPRQDDRADGLMEAARRSATLLDPHLLRVLDADTVDGACYVVNEWGEGESLDQMLLEGPLTPRRAAWIVSEVGSLLARAHRQGIAHGRLVPENVLVDESGAVKVIGLGVDAALHGLPADRLATDVADLAGVLYAALTGRWAGISRSAVPPAPTEHGTPLRPRRVRAGVPRMLDALCDEVLAPPSGTTQHDARSITAALEEYVGDPTAVAAAEVARARGTGLRPNPASEPSLEETRAIRPVGGAPATAPHPAGDSGDGPAAPPPGTAAGQEPASGAVEETRAAAPVFDDEVEDLDWATSRQPPAPPPPPFEEPPERPLFAPDPPGGRSPAAAHAPRDDTGNGYWPWEATGTGTGTGTGSFVVDDEEERDDRVPGRRWLRVAALIAVACLVLVAMAYAFDRGRDGRGPLAEEPSDDPSAVRVSPVRVSATDFDPQGDPPTENPDLASLAVDGDPGTVWRTMTYRQNLGPGGLKTGVGLLLDLGSVRDLHEVTVTFTDSPTAASLLVTESAGAPTAAEGLEEVAEGRAGDGNQLRLAPGEPVPARWAVVWLTAMPEVGDGFRSEVAEIVVRAS